MTTDQSHAELRPDLRAYLDDPSTRPREFAKFAINLMNLFDYSFDDIEQVLLDPEESWKSKSQVFYLRGPIAVLTSLKGRVAEVRTREYVLRSRDGVPVGDWHVTAKSYYAAARGGANDVDILAALTEPLLVCPDPRSPGAEWAFGQDLAVRRVPLNRTVTRVSTYPDATPYLQGTCHGDLSIGAETARRVLFMGYPVEKALEMLDNPGSKHSRSDGYDVYTKGRCRLLVRRSAHTIVAFSNHVEAFSEDISGVVDGVAIGHRVASNARRLGVDLHEVTLAVNEPHHEEPYSDNAWLHRRGDLGVVTTEYEADPTMRLVVAFSSEGSPKPTPRHPATALRSA